MQIVIDQNNANQRFDRFLRKYCKVYPEVKLGDIFAWIRKGIIKINGKKSKEKYMLQQGDTIEFKNDIVLGKKNPDALISIKDKKMTKANLDEIHKMIIFEDDHWLVFDKPYGVVMHPGNQHRNDLTMNDYLELKLKDKKGKVDTMKSRIEGDTFKPAFGYRLDEDTSGVLIAAKTYDSLQYLNEIIRERKIDKTYYALVSGKFPKKLVINKPLEKVYIKKFDRSMMSVKSGGMEAKTECFLEKICHHELLGDVSLIRVKLYTGRMHQIRVHLAYEGFPILGDIIYGNSALNRILYKRLKINRQLLHCYKYGFDDPYCKKIVAFQSPIPKDFDTIIVNS